MTNLKNIETQAKGWATLHIVAASAICFAGGFLLGLMF